MKNNIENKKITVIIPVYKVEKYLDKCVESVVSQTYKNLEIILVDDGSPDKCPTICDEWAKKDSRIKVIHKQNGGLSDARNVGIEQSSGDYIMFLDSDDYLDKTICEKLLNLNLKNATDFAFAFPKLIYENKEEPKVEVEKEIKTDVVKGFDVVKSLLNPVSPYMVTAWAKLYKKEIFKRVRFELNRLHEDEFILHKIFEQSKSFAYTTEELYYYLQREGTITKTRKDKSYIDTFDAFTDRLNYLKNFPELEQESVKWAIKKIRYTYLNMNKKVVSKEVQKKYLDAYKRYYKKLNKKTLKDIAFYICPNLCRLISK